MRADQIVWGQLGAVHQMGLAQIALVCAGTKVEWATVDIRLLIANGRAIARRADACHFLVLAIHRRLGRELSVVEQNIFSKYKFFELNIFFEMLLRAYFHRHRIPPNQHSRLNWLRPSCCWGGTLHWWDKNQTTNSRIETPHCIVWHSRRSWSWAAGGSWPIWTFDWAFCDCSFWVGPLKHTFFF